MNSTELTQKDLQERIDLESLQKKELDTMVKRHSLEAMEAPGKYFEEKREKQMQKLLDNHKNELARLFDTHNEKWEQRQNVKNIIRESHQLSFDLQPKRERYIKPEPVKETAMDKVKKFLHRKRKDHGQEI